MGFETTGPSARYGGGSGERAGTGVGRAAMPLTYGLIELAF
jgi:hypothetical protein